MKLLLDIFNYDCEVENKDHNGVKEGLVLLVNTNVKISKQVLKLEKTLCEILFKVKQTAKNVILRQLWTPAYSKVSVRRPT